MKTAVVKRMAWRLKFTLWAIGALLSMYGVKVTSLNLYDGGTPALIFSIGLLLFSWMFQIGAVLSVLIFGQPTEPFRMAISIAAGFAVTATMDFSLYFGPKVVQRFLPAAPREPD